MSWLLKGHCHEIYNPFLGQSILPEPHRNKLKGFAIFLGFAIWRIKNVCLCSCWLRRLGVSIVVDYAGRCNHWLHGYGCRWLSGNNNDRCLRTQQLCPHDDRVVNDYVDIYPHSQLLLYVDSSWWLTDTESSYFSRISSRKQKFIENVRRGPIKRCFFLPKKGQKSRDTVPLSSRQTKFLWFRHFVF